MKKITDTKIINLLKTIKNTEGTVAILELIKSIQKAYVDEDSTNKDRLINAVFATQFCRIWLQWINEEKRPKTECITQNSFEGLEINIVLVIKLLLEDKLDAIHRMSSQTNENFFRTLRSYTGVEHLDVNCSMKGFLTRVQRMQSEEILMNDLQEKYYFPTLSKRAFKNKRSPTKIEENDIEKYIKIGINKASSLCRSLGMNCKDFDLATIVSKVESWESIDIESDEEDFLDSLNDGLNQDSEDEDDSYEIMQHKNLELNSRKSSKYF